MRNEWVPIGLHRLARSKEEDNCETANDPDNCEQAPNNDFVTEYSGK
jgi:hypothetical protein